MTVLRGAWMPGRMLSLDVVHTFARADEPKPAERIAWLLGHKRHLLLTLEAWEDPDWRGWARALRGFPDGTILVRAYHEFNGNWGYPWQGDPNTRFLARWFEFADAMPPNVRRVWCPNVSYPGSRPLIGYWPGPRTVDVVALDGYARNGETPAELFRPTMEEMFEAGAFRERKPLWIAETAAPRGRQQARYAEALVAFCGQQGIEACLWFNEDKSKRGVDERDWSMTPSAERAFLGGRDAPREAEAPRRRREKPAEDRRERTVRR